MSDFRLRTILKRYTLLIGTVGFLTTGCLFIYDPPSTIIDPRLKLYNNSKVFLQFICSCDTINSEKFQFIHATVNTGNLIFPGDTFTIPGYSNWEKAIDKCPDKKLTVHIYKLTRTDTADIEAISQKYTWADIERMNPPALIRKFSAAELDSINWTIQFDKKQPLKIISERTTCF